MIIETVVGGNVVSLETKRRGFTNLFFLNGIWTNALDSSRNYLRWDDPSEAQASIDPVQLIHAFGFTGTTSDSGNIDIAKINCELELRKNTTSVPFSATGTVIVSAITDPFENTITDVSGIVSTQISAKTVSFTTGGESGNKASTSSLEEEMSVFNQSQIYGLLVEIKDVSAKMQFVRYVYDRPFFAIERTYYYSPLPTY